MIWRDGSSRWICRSEVDNANTRSVNRKELFIKDYVSENDIDILAITETWLQENNNDFSIAEMCPIRYQFHHVTRKNTRGGRFGLLLKKHIKVKKQSQKEFLLLST